jgi:hypothetical protein
MKPAYAILLSLAVALVIACLDIRVRGVSKFQASPKTARSLMSQGLHYYALYAQDVDPVHALVHASYALAYFTSAREITSDEILSKICKRSVREIYEAIRADQQTAATKLSASQQSV